MAVVGHRDVRAGRRSTTPVGMAAHITMTEGSFRAVDAAPVGPEEPRTVEDIPWEVGYERSAVERFVAGVEAEQTRLRAEIAAARERARAARDRAAGRSTPVAVDPAGDPSDVVLRAEEELAGIERELPDILRMIRGVAAEEAERIIAVARVEAADDRGSDGR